MQRIEIVVTAGAEDLLLTDPDEIVFDEVGTPILEYGRHPEYGLGWMLCYLTLNDGADLHWWTILRQRCHKPANGSLWRRRPRASSRKPTDPVAPSPLGGGVRAAGASLVHGPPPPHPAGGGPLFSGAGIPGAPPPGETMIGPMTDFYLIFQRLSDQDRAELAARTALKITDGLAKHIQAAGAGLTLAAVEVISSA